MKRELMEQEGKHRHGSNCCPGHDNFPHETYKSNRSKRARARDKKVEHQLARTIAKRNLATQINED
jgi:hypothetical protein